MEQKTDDCDEDICINNFSLDLHTQNTETGDLYQNIESNTIQKNKKCLDNDKSLADCRNDIGRILESENSDSGNLKQNIQ